MIEKILFLTHGTLLLLFGAFISGAFVGISFRKKKEYLDVSCTMRFHWSAAAHQVVCSRRRSRMEALSSFNTPSISVILMRSLQEKT